MSGEEDKVNTELFQRIQRLRELLARLRAPVQIPEEIRTESAPAVSSFGEEGFKDAVRRAKQYIVDGDVMQVVLSQRMSKPYTASPMALYRAIRSLNPSPYMFYFNFEDFHVVGASPEILTRLEDDVVTVRPIAGTRKRGATVAEDLALEKELLADEKERAEHLQLLDLGRNDAGRVSETGTVKVTERFTIERYSHVMHIVSEVRGKVRDGVGFAEVLKATFPAGTVSGAPKIRALEVIRDRAPDFTPRVGLILGSGLSGIAEAIVSKTGAVIATKDVALATDIARHDEQMDHLHRELFTIVLSPSWKHGVEAAIDVTLRKEVPILTAARAPGFNIEKLRAAWLEADQIK